MKLDELVNVRSGLVLARKQSKEITCFRYRTLNLKSIGADNVIDTDQLEVISTKESLEADYLTQKGDVVIRLTPPYNAVLIDEDTAGIVISSNFVVVRRKGEEVLPEYLAWLLNTSKIKRQIFESVGGSVLGSVKTQFFKELEIDLLRLDDQRRISELNQLARREVRLLKQLAEQKEKYYARLIGSVQKDMRGNKK